ncbi:MAG: glycosyltransferase family 2 protein, partial [Erysipelotrichaceae bacterium]
MKISIIIPVYNCESYLEQCLDSVCNQTLKDIEVIAVDDGSTDSSFSILERYRDLYPKVLHIYKQSNGGQASARNLALKYATGEFLGFVDSDDWIDKSMYEVMYNKAISTSSDLVICDMVDHYPNKTIYHNSSVFTDKFKVTPSACN